jgi:hypothetical protein
MQGRCQCPEYTWHGNTPSLSALALRSLDDPEVAQFLLGHGADLNARANEAST